MRVPFIVKWPAKFSGGKKEQTAVVSTDLYPTFLEAADVRLIPEQHKDGISLFPLFTGGELPEREIHFHFPHYTSNTSPYSVIVDGDWKLIRYYNDASGGFQLFNMKNDPYELSDLSASKPEIVKQLFKKCLYGKKKLTQNCQL